MDNQDWLAEASCLGVDPEVFQMKQLGDPGIPGNITSGSIGAWNKRRAKKAISDYCEGCPVRAACLEAAEAPDLYWSVRGGLMPSRFGEDRPGSIPSFRSQDYVEFRCSRGIHLGDGYRGFKDGSPYCTGCSNAAHREGDYAIDGTLVPW